jgi:hypothetical protein
MNMPRLYNESKANRPDNFSQDKRGSNMTNTKMVMKHARKMLSLKGKSFEYKEGDKTYSFYITRDYPKAIRVTINNTIQAVWLPKCFLKIENGNIIKANIGWKVNSKEFQYKLSLIGG